MILDFANKVIEMARALLRRAAQADLTILKVLAARFYEVISIGLMKILSLKERYFYTKSGQMRLRYLVLPVLVILVGVPLLIAGVARVQGLSLTGSEMASTDDRDTSLAAMLDGSLYGQLSLVSAMTRSAGGPTDKTFTVEPGDALGSIMEKAGIGSKEAHEVVSAMKEEFDPRQLKAGQNVHMHFQPSREEGGMRFAKMKIPLSPIKTLIVAREDGGFVTSMDEKEVKRVVRAERAQIEVSLYGSAAKAGIPSSVIANAIRVYSWNVDFQRDIRQGDTIEIMYESFETREGHIAETGNILFANLTLNGKAIPLYRFDMADGRSEYFGPDGISIKRTLMKTPIDGARMSSGFGMRRHPILGYNKMHKGADFAAPSGTPIYAAGDGIVEKAGWNGGYGRYVRIRHNSSLKTAYAHMSKIHKRSKIGKRVTQGEIIGYVGTSGRSTGPHLHYEVHNKGHQVNPRSVNLPTGEELAGGELKKFKNYISSIDQEYASLTQGRKFAFNFGSKDKEDEKSVN